MALINTLSVPILDDKGDTTRVPIHFPAAATVAQIQAFWDTVILELDVVTAGVIGVAQLTVNLSNAGSPKTGALLDHFNNMAWRAGYVAADTTYRHTQYVPSLRNTLIVAGEPFLDTGNPLEAWRDRMLAGDGVIFPTNKYGDDLTTYLEGKLSFLK